MVETLEKNVRTWAATRPQTIRVFNRLTGDRLRWAIFSGSLPAWLDPEREHRDVDLIAWGPHFDEISRRLPGARVAKMAVDFQSVDGVKFSGETDRVTAALDGGRTELEMLRPFEVQGSHGRRYFFELEPWAAEACHLVEAGGAAIPLDVIGTKVVKAAFRREGDKSDSADIRTLTANLPAPPEQVARRLVESGCGQREMEQLGFVKHLGYITIGETLRFPLPPPFEFEPA